MNDLNNFFLTLCGLTENSVFQLFGLYVIAYFIINMVVYTAENLAGIDAVTRWYDAVVLVILIIVFVLNVKMLIHVKQEEVTFYKISEKES